MYHTSHALNQMKRFGIIVLSMLVLYAGGAWAFENCLPREGHAGLLASETHHDSHSSLSHTHPADDAFLLFHCFSPFHRMGSAIETPRTKLALSAGEVSLGASQLLPPPEPEGAVHSGRLIFFRRILTFCFYSDLGHHLFLSVLRI